MKPVAQRASYNFLCLIPLLNFGVVSVRSLRIPGFYQLAGIVYCAAIVIAGWSLAAPAIRHGKAREQKLAFAGGFLIFPSAVIGLLWVGLGIPSDATPVENRMRYLVLLLGTIGVTAGFLLLEDAVRDAGERLFSKMAAAFAILAGVAYLFWNSFCVGMMVIKVRTGQFPAELISMSEVLDSVLFTACVLTYLATFCFALAMSRARFLERRGRIGYTSASLVLLALLLLRGLSFPNPKAGSTPWYLNPGFIAGIPAVPWMLAYWLGAGLLRRLSMEATVQKTGNDVP